MTTPKFLSIDVRNIRSPIHCGIRIAVATILVVAGILKLLNAQDSFAHPGYGSFSGANSVVVAVVEIILAIWILILYLPAVSWGICFLLFGLYCVASLEKVIAGASSCGCLGGLSINPWVMLLIDFLVLVAIVWSFPRPGFRHLNFSRSTFAGAAAAMILAAVGFLMIQTNDAVARFFLQADVVISPQLLDIGMGKSGTVVEKTLQISNIGNKPVTLIGARNTRTDNLCSDLPVTLDPGTSQNVRIKCALSGSKGGFGRRLFFYTTSDVTPQPFFTVVGIVE